MSYTHLTEQERVCIFHQQMCEFSHAEIGRRLNRHRATIGRELKRFRKHPGWAYFRQYFPDSADHLARQRRSRPRGLRWTKHRPLLAYVLRKLRQEWSPEQISGRIKEDFPDDPRMRVSHPSLYRYLQADRKAGGSLWKRLRQATNSAENRTDRAHDAAASPIGSASSNVPGRSNPASRSDTGRPTPCLAGGAAWPPASNARAGTCSSPDCQTARPSSSTPPPSAALRRSPHAAQDDHHR